MSTALPATGAAGPSSSRASNKSSAGNSKIPTWATLASGATSGFASCVLLQPMDLLKTRMQQQRASTRRAAADAKAGPPKIAPLSARTNRLVQVTKDVIAEDGLKGLWRGTVPTVVRNVPGVALYFYSVTELRRLLAVSGLPLVALAPAPSASSGATTSRGGSASTVATLTTTGNLVSGAIARVTIGFILCPVTVVKTRFESSHFSKTSYPSVSKALAQIYATSGVRGLFQGFTATALRDAPYAGLYLSVYEGSKARLGRMKLGGEGAERGSGSAVVTSTSGLIAGTVATLLTHPFDVLKTRIQIQTQPDSRSSTAAASGSSPLRSGAMAHSVHTSARPQPPQLTLLGTVRHTLATEGAGVFLDGLGLRCARKAASSAIGWTIFEGGRGLWVASDEGRKKRERESASAAGTKRE